MNTQVKTLADAGALLSGRLGLVIGQDCSTKLTAITIDEELRKIACDHCEDSALKSRLASEDFASLLDELASLAPTSFTRFRLEAEKYLQALAPHHAVSKLSKVGWSAVVSLCLDRNLEEQIRERLQLAPTQRRVTVVANTLVLGRSGLTLPIYKLLGNCRDSSADACIALSKSEVLFRERDWRPMLSDLSHYLREAPLLVMGTSKNVELVRGLASAIFSGQAPYPSALVFMEGDPCGTDPVIARLANGRSNVVRISGSIDQVVELLETPKSLQLKLQLVGGGSDKGAWEKLTAFRNIVDVVPNLQPAYSFQSHRQEILDSLFRPVGINWDPFLFDIELPRSRVNEIVNRMGQLSISSTHVPAIAVLRGEAGIGKSVVAKRVAIELSKAGHLVLWCKRVPSDYFPMYRDLVKALREITKNQPNTKVFVVCDDPWAIGISPVDLATLFETTNTKACILIVTRNSDRAIHHGGLRLPYFLDEEFELDFDLTKDEQEALPSFLTRIGAASNQIEASRITGSYVGKSATDILCRLWYLVPDARDCLERSLGDEYYRLENVDRLIGDLADSAASHSSIARRAYEAVAVASGMGIGIPTEVLVNSLKINFSDWISLCTHGKPLWGLLYPVEIAETDQVLYFTRNAVVTEVLLKLINGGVGHASELRVMNNLVGACNGSSPPYRDFLIDLFAKHKVNLRRIATPQEGRALYELALRSFPVPDRTLVHHYGKWVSDEVHNHGEAYAIMERALETPDYPYSHEERREFIHTSMAAVVVRRVELGEQDRETGLLAIKRHLREGTSPTFFNLHTVHVQVEALLRLQRGADPISIESFIEAFRTIERAHQLAGSSAKRQSRLHEALNLLNGQKRRLAELLPAFSTLKDDALVRFETEGQQFVLEAAATRGLLDATISDKGTDYNEVGNFLKKCQERVVRKGQQLSSGLRQVRVDLIVRWRLQRDIGEVDWATFLGDIREIRDDPSRRDDVLLLFYEGVACFHQRLEADARVAFHRLRGFQMPNHLTTLPRLFLRNRQGKPEQVQGQYTRSGGRDYVHVADYSYDVIIQRSAPQETVRPGGVVHCWIVFSLQGPTVEFKEPTASSFLLPN